MDELRDIPGYEGLYGVTRDGRVFSHPRKHPPGIRGRVHSGIWLSTTLTWKGYLKVGLLRGGIRSHIAVHRLVALAWLPPVNGATQVNHKNGVKTDNRAQNLEWCTPKQNIAHSIATGLRLNRSSPQ